MNIRTILYPTDFSPCAQLAFAHAADLARRNDATLHLVHVVALHSDLPYDPMFYVPAADVAYARAEADAQAGLAELSRSPAAGGLTTVTAVLRAGAAAPAILEYAQRHDIDLIVMGTHGRRGAVRLLLGSIAEEVLRHSACPVLTLREDGRDPASASHVPPREILVPFDFSPPSRLALAAAAALARQCGARLRLLHVVDEAPAVTAGTLAEVAAARDQRMLRLRLRLADVLAYLAKDVSGEIELRVGVPGEEILRAGEEQRVDLIVMATRGLTGVKRLLFGSTAEQVMRLATAPLLVVKPAEAEPPAMCAPRDRQPVAAAR
jgi:nucleotide-binding universal stress UspA family protein